MNDTTNTNDTQIDAMFSGVDIVGSAAAEPDFTAAQRRQIEDATRTAYYAARGRGADVETAKRAGVDAATKIAESFADTQPAPPPIVMNSTTPAANDIVDFLSDLPARHADFVAACDAVDALGAPPEMATQETHAGSEAAGVDSVGLARSERDRAAAVAAGFTVAETVYTRGLRVIEAGVVAARRSREEYDRKPLVSEMCAAFVTRIANEKRADVVVPAASIRMNADGSISALPGRVDAAGERFDGTLDADAFPSLCSRMGFASGARYLRDKCKPELRAHNVNEQAATLAATEAKEAAAERDAAKKEGRAAEPIASLVSLRTRRAPNDTRSVFAVTSPTYAAPDARSTSRPAKRHASARSPS